MQADKRQIIILNGVGSVGKSSVARAVQDMASVPLLHFSMDGFLEMLPEKLFGHRDGLVFNAAQVDGRRVVSVEVGAVGKALLSGMRHAVLAMARQGNSLIVDDVMLNDEAAGYRALLAGYDVRFVRLSAPLEVLEERERLRGVREIGLARGQYDAICLGGGYDLEVDTSVHTPGQCAKLIVDAFGL